MPQLNLLKDPVSTRLKMTVWAPALEGGRWGLQVAMDDADGRPLESGAWMIGRACEHADIGHVLRDAYDAWFNATPHQVCSAVERSLRYRL